MHSHIVMNLRIIWILFYESRWIILFNLINQRSQDTQIFTAPFLLHFMTSLPWISSYYIYIHHLPTLILTPDCFLETWIEWWRYGSRSTIRLKEICMSIWHRPQRRTDIPFRSSGSYMFSLWVQSFDMGSSHAWWTQDGPWGGKIRNLEISSSLFDEAHEANQDNHEIQCWSSSACISDSGIMSSININKFGNLQKTLFLCVLWCTWDLYSSAFR